MAAGLQTDVLGRDRLSKRIPNMGASLIEECRPKKAVVVQNHRADLFFTKRHGARNRNTEVTIHSC